MSKSSALLLLGETIVEAGKGGDAFGPLIALSPLIMGGQPLPAAIDALPTDATTEAKAAALQTLVGIIGELLVSPKFAAPTKAALRGLLS